jgi:hypothetical protein
MYTIEMATAFKSIVPPKNFGVTIMDSDNFLTIVIDPKDIDALLDDEKQLAAQYIKDVKSAFEKLGAIVYIVRNALED